jgi:hypothetical protein
MNLNPIFKTNDRPASTPKPLLRPAAETNVTLRIPLNDQVQVSQRKQRSDKTHDIKFPVTPEQKAEIRRLAKSNGMKGKETYYATKMLLSALSFCKTLPEYNYNDTKLYMHVKPTETYYEMVFALAANHGISERQAVTRLVIYVLNQRGGRV